MKSEQEALAPRNFLAVWIDNNKDELATNWLKIVRNHQLTRSYQAFDPTKMTLDVHRLPHLVKRRQPKDLGRGGFLHAAYLVLLQQSQKYLARLGAALQQETLLADAEGPSTRPPRAHRQMVRVHLAQKPQRQGAFAAPHAMASQHCVSRMARRFRV